MYIGGSWMCECAHNNGEAHDINECAEEKMNSINKCTAQMFLRSFFFYSI